MDVSGDPARTRWLLSSAERGNADTDVDNGNAAGVAYLDGCHVEPLVHGATYFSRLVQDVQALERGDQLWFTDWRGDADEQLTADGPSVRDLLCAAATRGVDVRGLVWRSHSDRASFSAQQNEKLGANLNAAGAQVLLDQRVRRFGSHHQKLVILRRPADPARDVAFVGGIDLCHSRRDDVEHGGDPQPQPMDRRYGPRAPWHDMTLALRGPVVGALARTFAERWNDPAPLDHRDPYRMVIQRREHMPRHPAPLPAMLPAPGAAGGATVQVLRTYARKRRPFPFARDGERSVARAYDKAFSLAHSLIYLEDQYLWSEPVARRLAAALRRDGGLQVIAVVPRYPDSDGTLMGPVNRLGQLEALRLLQATAPGRVGVFDIENGSGTPIYVHAKVCVVDDVWVTCGSDNLNRRSWTTDSELSCAIVDSQRDDRQPTALDAFGDGARVVARDLRLQLWAEHLGLDVTDPQLLDPDPLAVWQQRAAALDAWYAGGCRGTRPPGQVRAHAPAPVTGLWRALATPIQRLVADPDGRTRQMRRADLL